MEFRGQEEEPGEEEEEPVSEEMGASSAPPPAPVPASGSQNHAGEAARYHECLRNHAAALGGHVVDGCGEFMPGGGDGDGGDRLKCAACGCHRSFHRKDDARRGVRHQQLLLPAPVVSPTTATATRVPLLLPPPHPHYAAAHPHYASPPTFPYHGTPSGSGGGTTTESSSEERGPPSGTAGAAAQGHVRRKRFRTKFTPEQKEQMLAFAERLGWRMQKQDDALVQHFCDQVGVRRQVFKVWMHNNKHAGRRQPTPQGQQHTQQQPQTHQQPQQEQ